MGNGLTLVQTIITVVGSVTAAVLAAIIGAYLTHRLRKKGEDGSNRVEAQANIQEGNTTNISNQLTYHEPENQVVCCCSNFRGTSSRPRMHSPPMDVVGTNSHLPPLTTVMQATSQGKSNITSSEQEVVDKVEPIIMGPWGHPNEGFSFNHNGYDGIKTIKIWCGWVIDSIEVQYTKRGMLQWASKAGGLGGNLQEEIVLEDGEYINEVMGTYGRLFGMGTVNSLTFFTNKNGKYGPYGLNTGTLRAEIEAEPTPFQVRGVKIVGFHGTSGSRFISSIGFYVTPLFDT